MKSAVAVDEPDSLSVDERRQLNRVVAVTEDRLEAKRELLVLECAGKSIDDAYLSDVV